MSDANLVKACNGQTLQNSADYFGATNLEGETKKRIFEAIQHQLVETYGDSYVFENFTYDINKVRLLEGDRLIDIDVYVDMTLTRSASENEYIQGMLEMANKLEGNEKLFVKNEIKPLIMDIEEAYYNPRNVRVLYTVKIGDPRMEIFESFELYSRVDFLGEEESLLNRVHNIKSKNIKDKENAFENGYQTVVDIIANTPETNISEGVPAAYALAVASVQYDRIKARDWARDNRDKAPEYNSADKTGSDCANFVSRAINQGGIPQDISGNWAHWSNGSTLAALKYINWFRTGFNNNGGVVPYLVNKNYFYHESSLSKAFAGSIIYNTKRSHVGLVTSGDGSNIYYADHSDVKKSGRETLLQKTSDPSFEQFTFYLPYSSILKP